MVQISCFSSIAKENNFFNEAKKLFEEENFDESKFLFQRNIVYNPKDAKSYLFLAKIFKKEENKSEEEKNLNTTLLLEPKNEEAMYLLIDIEIINNNDLLMVKGSNATGLNRFSKNIKRGYISAI